MSADQQVIETFSKMPGLVAEQIVDLKSAKLKGLAGLMYAKSSGIDRLTVRQVCSGLSVARIPVHEKTVRNVFTSEKNCVKAERADGQTFYRLMIGGERLVREIFDRGDEVDVVAVDSERPRTSKQSFEKLTKVLHGESVIFDPYLGPQTLDALQKLIGCPSVRFLTNRIAKIESSFERELRDFIREFPHFEFRMSSKDSHVHDRYLIGQNVMILVGHGLKDLGKKDSFVVSLPRAEYTEVVSNTLAAFEKRWRQAEPVLR